ncbi:hypothetical protein BCF59_0377 [Mycoplasmopsis mustelae]|uniref:Lipoprotein n=1 Tax=Mycoplasmopsis mustelae TaxID=171289 RepID=A0A4R7UD58_9BACT|nr:hypothetical protein [Mycoplasmopsis mustelae]TDV24412.1 hypothetical protein BCF59_0377 [Mycoplasmopsis mustelae]
MNKKYRKFKLMLLPATATIATVAVACGNNQIKNYQNNPKKSGSSNTNPNVQYRSESDLQQIINPVGKYQETLGNQFSTQAKQGFYTRFVNSPYKENTFDWDKSSTYGSIQSFFSDAIVAKLVERVYFGNSKIEEKKIIDSQLNEVITRKIIQPTVSKFSLQLADAIILTVNGVDKVYDSDDAPLMKGPDLPDGSYSSNLINLQSDNSKSINSTQFLKDLKNTNKIKFRIRKNTKYINNKGELTKYNVRANDFRLGLLRTLTNTDTNYRLAHGGSNTLDELARQGYIVNGSTKFKQDASYVNTYLFDLYNVDFNKILDSNESVETNGNDEFFVIKQKSPNTPANFDLFFNSTLLYSYEMQPISTEYITEKSQNLSKLPYFFAHESNLTNEQKTKIREELLNVSGIAKETGAYWYANTPELTLYAGKYYFAGYNNNSFQASWKLNTNYWDKNYLNNPRRIKTFIEQHTNNPVSKDALPKYYFNNYKAGLYSTVSFSELEQSDKDIIEKDATTYGLRTTQSKNVKNQTGFIYPTLIPQTQDVSGSSNTINDAFAKLVYGNSLENIKAGKATNVVKAYTTGLGAEFMNILSAVINWNEVSRENLKPNPSIPWISGFAEDIKIRNNDNDKSLEFNTLRPYYDKLSTLFVVDSDTGEKVDLGGNLGNELQPSENSSTNKTAKEVYQSAAFPALKERFKKLLDKFFAAHTEFDTTEKQVVNLHFLSPYTNESAQNLGIYAGITEVYNSLDPRFKVTTSNTSVRKEIINYYSHSSIPWTRTGWGYDYNLVGSGFDGFTTYNGQLFNVFALILSDTEYKTKLSKSYPLIVKAAERFKEFIDNNNYKFSIPFNKLSNLGNKYTSNISVYMNSYKLNDQNNLVKLSEQEKNNYTNLGEITSKFWLWLNTSESTENDFNKANLLELIKEYRNLTGVNFTINGALKDSFAKILRNPNYVIPSTQDNPTNWTSVQVVVEK